MFDHPVALPEPAPRLVLFDLDDTLCDYAGARMIRLRTAFATAIEAAGTEHVIDVDSLIERSLAVHPHGTDHFVELLGEVGVGPEAAVQAVAWYRINRFHGLELFSDARIALATIRRAMPARRIGLVTNGPADVQRAKIDLLDLAKDVDFALVSGEFGIAKPAPEIFAEALRLGGATADETIFIGDSVEFDMAGAHNAGIRAIWMNPQAAPWSSEFPAPTWEARHLGEVVALLGGNLP